VTDATQDKKQTDHVENRSDGQEGQAELQPPDHVGVVPKNNRHIFLIPISGRQTNVNSNGDGVNCNPKFGSHLICSIVKNGSISSGFVGAG